MDDSPTFEQLAFELALSLAISSVVALAFVLWGHPLAYFVLGALVAGVLLRRRLAAPVALPRWVALAIVPIDAMLWPTAVVGDVLRAHAESAGSQDDSTHQTDTDKDEETSEEDGPGNNSDQPN